MRLQLSGVDDEEEERSGAMTRRVQMVVPENSFDTKLLLAPKPPSLDFNVKSRRSDRW